MQEPYLQPAMPYGRDPKMTVEIQKQDNGFTLQLTEPVDFAADDEAAEKELEEALKNAEKSADEIIDDTVEGLAAFFRYINDKGAGEEWKDGGDKEKIRAGFKAFLHGHLPGGVARRPRAAPSPRHESLVFPKKEELLAYLAKNL